MAGIADRTGSLTPGKKADVVIIDGSAVNVAPIIDPVAAVVLAADISNVKTVFIDGVLKKHDHKLLADLTAPRKAVEASRDFLVSQVEPQAGWVVARGEGLAHTPPRSNGRLTSGRPPVRRCAGLRPAAGSRAAGKGPAWP